MYKIAFITDLHLPEDHQPVRGVDTWLHFQIVLDEVVARMPDHIILGGDLCYKTGNAAVYQEVKTMMDATGIPYEVIAGNHDDSEQVAKCFYAGNTLQHGAHYFARHLGSYAALFLDTSKGTMNDDQWQWLHERIEHHVVEDLLVFMHHPPFMGMLPHMDLLHAFKEQDRFATLVEQFAGSIHIYTGHYHTDRHIIMNNCVVTITPSCFVQITGQSVDFELDHTYPAYRIIQLEDRQITSELRYVFKMNSRQSDLE